MNLNGSSEGRFRECLRYSARIFLDLYYLKKTHYFSTHGCNRFVSCFAVGALDELAVAAAAACRALISKKLAIVLFELLRVDDAVVVLKDATRREAKFKQLSFQLWTSID